MVKQKQRKRNGTPRPRGANSRAPPINNSPYRDVVGGGQGVILTKSIFAWDYIVVPLKYVVPNILLTTGANAICRIFQNDAYDVDTALGSTAMAGFTEYAAIFSRFRTLEMSWDFSFSNQEAIGICAIAGASPTLLTTTTLGLNYAENPHFKMAEMGAVGGQNRARLTGKASIQSITGTKQALYDDLFTGSTTSSTLATTGHVYVYGGVVSPAATVLAAGAHFSGSITLLVHFYRRNALIS